MKASATSPTPFCCVEVMSGDVAVDAFSKMLDNFFVACIQRQHRLSKSSASYTANDVVVSQNKDEQYTCNVSRCFRMSLEHSKMST